jgi:hypothetical protein
MLGLGGNISSSAPVGVSGATQPDQSQQWTLFYESDFTSSTDGWASGAYILNANDSISGRTGLLKFTDKDNHTSGASIYKSFNNFANSVNNSGKIKVYVEYYIPSNLSSLETVSKVMFNGIEIDSALDISYDEFKEEEFVQELDSSIVSNFLYIYASDLATSSALTPDNTGAFGFISKIRIYL